MMKKIRLKSMAAIILFALLTAVLAIPALAAADSENTMSPADYETRAKLMHTNSINVFGDSITHGANANDIPSQSYLGLLKKKLAEKTGVYNYGFVSVEDRIYNVLGDYQEIHKITNVGFTAGRDGRYINAYRMIATHELSSLDITVAEKFKEAYVYYQKGEGNGTFDIIVGDSTVMSIDSSDGEGPAIAGPIDISAYDSAQIKIMVTSEGKDVIITGMAYYNDTNNIVINNYASNGLSLFQLEDDVIDMICNTNTLLFSIGHNDSYNATKEDFTAKINTVINCVKKYGTRVYVNDFCWFSDPDTNHFKLELKRLAEECGGVYTDYANEIPDFLTKGMGDWAHPNIDGHKMLYDLMVTKLDFLDRDIKVTLDANGGEALTEAEKTVSFGNGYGELKNAKRSGYAFLGWYTHPQGGDKVTADTVVANGSDHTLYAHWEKSHVVRNTLIAAGAVAVALMAAGAGIMFSRRRKNKNQDK